MHAYQEHNKAITIRGGPKIKDRRITRENPVIILSYDRHSVPLLIAFLVTTYIVYIDRSIVDWTIRVVIAIGHTIRSEPRVIAIWRELVLLLLLSPNSRVIVSVGYIIPWFTVAVIERYIGSSMTTHSSVVFYYLHCYWWFRDQESDAQSSVSNWRVIIAN